MNHDPVLIVPDRINTVERLENDPPTTWDGATAWVPVRRDGSNVMQEYAVVSCLRCENRAYWADGRFACSHCQTQMPLSEGQR
jgi:hypothetical protein